MKASWWGAVGLVAAGIWALGLFSEGQASASSPSADSENDSSRVAEGAGPDRAGQLVVVPLAGSTTMPIVRVMPEEPADPCTQKGVVATPTRPAWDYAAATTQCGIAEADAGFLGQSMGAGITQRMLVSSIRYGLTPRLDLRWGMANHIVQSGEAEQNLEGVGDDWVNVRYRFHEQGRKTPAMAFLYGAKIPVANPAKGLGSGFVDHQFIFIASRDLGRYHLDFNTVGTLAGEKHGHDGAAQFGLAVTRPLSKKLSGILESYGGPQPGSPDRFGAVFAGAVYTLRPQLVLDAAYARTYTAGSPRQQVLVGVTFASRPGFAPLSHGSALARLLGR